MTDIRDTMTFDTIILDIGTDEVDFEQFVADNIANEYLYVYRGIDPGLIKTFRELVIDHEVVAVIDPADFTDDEFRAEHINHLIDIGVDAIEIIYDRDNSGGFLVMRDMFQAIPRKVRMGVQYPIEVNRDWQEMKRIAMVIRRHGVKYFRPVIGPDPSYGFNVKSRAPFARRLQNASRLMEVRMSPGFSAESYGGSFDKSKVARFGPGLERDLLFVW